MRYSAILMVLSGLVIAGFTGVRYAIDEPPEWVENSFALELALPLVLAVALVTTGSALWAFGRWGYTVSGLTSGRDPAGAAGGTL
jgi:hypothetical protein